MGSLTRNEIDFLRSLSDLQALPWWLDLYRKDPAVAVDVRLECELQLPPGVFDGFTKEQAAQFFGVRTETIDGMVRNGMPIQRRGRRPGGVGRHQRSGFNVQDCAEWICEQKTKSLTSDVESEKIAEADVLYRQEKTKIQELQRKRLEGQLVDIHVFEERAAGVIDTIRKGIESLHRTFGDEVVEALTKLMDEAESQLFVDDRKDKDK